MRLHRIAAVTVMVGLALCLASPRAARAAGFAITEHSARIMGMAGSFTAIADSPGATFFNPAGLVQLDGLQLELRITLVAPTFAYTGKTPDGKNDVTVDAVKHLFPIPNIHAVYRVHDRVAVGVGLTAPYGLTSEWDNKTTVNGKEQGWWGRGLIRKIALQTVYINPTVSVKLHERIMLGLGFVVAPGSVTLERSVTLSADPADDVDFKMSGSDIGFGATAGVLVKVLPKMLNVGVAFRSGASYTFEGNAAFTKEGDASKVPAGLRSRLVDGTGSAELNLPHVLSFGVAAFPMDGLAVSFTFDLITWSAYDKLEIKFADNPDLDVSEPKEWANAFAIRVGAEYEIFEWLPVRAGFIFDQSPVPDTTIGPELPDGDRYEFTLGAGYRWRALSVDLAYQYLTTGDIGTADTAPLVGTYKADAHLVGLSVGYKLDI